MSVEPVCCPYCNAFVPLPAGEVQQGQKLLCSRCGETFPFRGTSREIFTASMPQPLIAPAPQPSTHNTALTKRYPWSNRAIAAVVLGGMAVMAGLGLLIALNTQSARRAHDAGLPKDRTLPLYLTVFIGVWVVGLAFVALRELRLRYQRTYQAQRLPLGYVLATVTFLAIGGLAVTVLAVQISKRRASRPALADTRGEVHAQAPAALPTLGYLPPDTDLIAGVHVGEMLADPAASSLLTRLRLGGTDMDLNLVEKWTGLRLRDMDHIVLGLRVQGQLIPRVNLIVRTLRPYDAETIRKTLHASRAPEPSRKELYRVKLEKSFLTPIIWFADERTLIVGLKSEDFEPLPAKPREGIEHLQLEIGSMLKDRLGQGTPAWIVGRAENWDTQLAIALAPLKKEGQPTEIFDQVRAFGVWLQFHDGLTLNAAFQCADEGSAATLQGYLSGAGVRGNKPFALPVPRPELQPIFRELGQSAKFDRNGAWVVVQARASAQTMNKLVQR